MSELDPTIGKLFNKVLDDEKFLQENTDLVRDIMQTAVRNSFAAMQQAKQATCKSNHMGLQCQLPSGHEGWHQKVVVWEETEDSHENMHPQW